MGAICTQITFDMQDGEREWRSVLSLDGLIDMTIDQRFTPENFGEEIVIKIQRHTHQSREYSDYLNRISEFRF